jgi:hypothetical protein
MVKAVYAIDDFPDDDLLWRIEWIGGIGHNMSVPSGPLIDVCLTQLLAIPPLVQIRDPVPPRRHW